MIASVETIKRIIDSQGLKFLVCYDMANQSKLHQAENSSSACCNVLDETVMLMGSEPFRVEAWEEKNEGGGKPSKLAKTFKWIVKQPQAQAQQYHAPQAAQPSTEILAAIQGLTDRLDAMDSEPDDDDDETTDGVEWKKAAGERGFAYLDRLLGLQVPPAAAAITGTAPAVDVSDADFVKACLLAKKDPANAGFVNQLLTHYGPKKGTDEPAKG